MSDPVPTEQDYLEAARADATAYFTDTGAEPTGRIFEETVTRIAQRSDLRAAVDSAFAAGVRAGRSMAAQAILAHAAEHFPQGNKSNDVERARWRARTHFDIAARLADATTPSLEEVANALASGEAAFCYLDEAGRPVPSGLSRESNPGSSERPAQ